MPIIEEQAPAIEVQTWLKYSQFIQELPELIKSISFGGENCFDMGGASHNGTASFPCECEQ